jgi:hypothetical protein
VFTGRSLSPRLRSRDLAQRWPHPVLRAGRLPPADPGPHGLITRLDQLASRPGHQLICSAGWDLSERERRTIVHVPGRPGRSLTPRAPSLSTAGERGRMLRAIRQS